MRAQVAAFSKRIPLLYFVLLVNCVTLSFTTYGQAPVFFTLILPAALAALSVVRIMVWVKAKPKEMSNESVKALLGRLYTLGLGTGTVVIIWALVLFQYADESTRGHIAVVVGLTVIAGMFCLMHVRKVALLMTVIVTIPFATRLFSTLEPTYIGMAINLLLVIGAMTVMLMVVSNDFGHMVRNRAETKRLSDENARIAATDSLTDLPNRRQFFGRLDGLLAGAQHHVGKLAVGVIDLDGFKPVNDLYGHVVGDQVLAQVGQRLMQIDESVFVARLGGDEFGLILPAGDPERLMTLGAAMCDALAKPFETHSAVATIGCSIGFSVLQDAETAAMTLYERADFALYYAKLNGRGRPVIFSEMHATALRKQGILDQALRKADLETEMTVVFQPVFDATLNLPVAFEALARWSSPTLGEVPPSDFIPAAERSEIISKLTHTLLRKALGVARGWPGHIGIAFNLSVRDLISPASILQIISIVNTSGVDPNRIDFEVTETALLLDFDQAQESIRALKALGARISLDDFGTGYSSLSYVHRLPLDKIKIDRSFIADIETKDACRNIVKTVVGLCRELRIDCVVEGMETEAQTAILRKLGCNSMQGYFFSKPLSGEFVDAMLRAEAEPAETSLVA